MFLPGLFVANAALCAAALGFAAFVRPGRKEAVALAALLYVNFVFCALGYTAYAPKNALAAIGLAMTTKETWMIADALYGCAAVLAFRRWWGWALWATAVVQILVHQAYLLGAFDEFFYTDRLQDILHAQIAVFLLLGGRGVGNYMLGLAVRMRGFFQRPTAAPTRATSRAASTRGAE